jgi:putative transposase
MKALRSDSLDRKNCHLAELRRSVARRKAISPRRLRSDALLSRSSTASDLCRKHGISDATFYKWRSRFGGMEISEARKLKALEEENRKLKKLLAETMLDASTLKEMLGKNF